MGSGETAEGEPRTQWQLIKILFVEQHVQSISIASSCRVSGGRLASHWRRPIERDQRLDR